MIMAVFVFTFRELAAYESQPDAVIVTEDDLLKDGPFDKGANYYRCLVVENSEKELIGYALYFPIYSTWQVRHITTIYCIQKNEKLKQQNFMKQYLQKYIKYFFTLVLL